MQTDLAFGIDLGTTNSAMSILIGKEGSQISKIIKLSSGKTTIPSCIMWKGGDDFEVGDLAYKYRSQDNCVYSMKQYMGTDHKEMLIYNGESREIDAIEFSSLVLKKLREEAENIYGVGQANKVTITCPAYFTNKQREDTKKAGQLAGWDVVRIINEPTSASLAYSMGELKKSETILAFDLGGGTFDVNVIRLIKTTSEGNKDFPLLDLTLEEESEDEKISVKILSTDGDVHLGGDDFDYYLTEEALASAGISKDQLTRQEYRDVILRLEQEKKAGVYTSRTIYIKDKMVRIDKEFFRRGFNKIWAKCKAVTERCLASSTNKSIDKVVMIGGSTKLSWYKEELNKILPDAEIYDQLNPDESVALGASVQTGLALGTNNIMSVTDVLPISIGVGMENDIYKAIIRKDTPIPCKNSLSLGFNVKVGNNKLHIPVYQGINRKSSLNCHLGDVYVKLHSDEEYKIYVETEFKIDLNGILKVTAKTDSDMVEAEFKTVEQASSTSTVTEKKDNADLPVLNQIRENKYVKWSFIINNAPSGELKDQGQAILTTWRMETDNEKIKEIEKQLMPIIKKLRG